MKKKNQSASFGDEAFITAITIVGCMFCFVIGLAFSSESPVVGSIFALVASIIIGGAAQSSVRNSYEVGREDQRLDDLSRRDCHDKVPS